MASDGYPVQLTALNPLHGSGASSSVGVDRGGKSQPTSGTTAAEAASAAAASVTAASIAAAFAAAAFAAAASAAKPSNAAQAAPSSSAAAGPGVFKAKATAAVPAAPVPTLSHTASTAAKATTPDLKAPMQRASDPRAWAAELNKSLNDSGRPDQFRIDPSSEALIQQINPANGEVVGQFSSDEFEALSKSIGATGLFVDALV
jgi:hypothetical protein